MNPYEPAKEFYISKKLRFIENLHIVFWLIKDMCWCLEFKTLGITMAVPTICISIYFIFKNKADISELYHNMAVFLWIIANTWWMSSEFFKFDENTLILGLKGRSLAAFPFGSGILLLLIFYISIYPKQIQTNKNH
ncbi:hypothetical protein HUE46_04300 [Flavobacterium columnare]|uniref:hypothetical protein n=1 Tax=Flavobacterium columnare TaxID=996 RepID=UPI000980C003|nr:hypothetical protein [Flavobacterium columnare]MBF6659345.1 hypothetical protein [Flavobacterium columnare]OOB82770.1 hypothetical protein BZL53_07355 [Flavobacterium columnare]QOG89296.1 hypothetical protein HUE41_04300 [Flavobacterium columnare]QOG91955.1 hypothetical protein HUE42_04295 [Flavobacterium columnare]QOG94619.1 hypothetical protein HUE43_04300 [Flavobacterium columnare]